MRIAVLAGPESGSGDVRAAAFAALPGFLAGGASVCCSGAFGVPDSLLSSLPGMEEVAAPSGAGYVADLRAAVTALCAWEPDLLVCLGGDGLASYAADAMIGSGAAPGATPGTAPGAGAGIPIFGVAAGTANVGPIVCSTVDDLRGLDPARLVLGRVDAVDVSVDGVHVAYAFNDAVIADSFLGTLAGIGAVNLSAAEMLKSGRKIPVRPSPDIATEAFSVRKNGVEVPRSPELPGLPAQIVISPLRPRELYGRAVGGVLCSAAFLPGVAAMALLDSVVIVPGNPSRGFSQFARSEHLLFEPGDRVELSGLAPGAHLIVDGNPFPAGTGPASRVAFSPAPAIVEVASIVDAMGIGEATRVR